MEQCLALYDEKINILKEVLRVTANTKIEGNMANADEEAEDYIALMEKRKGFFEKILAIDEKMKECGDVSGNKQVLEKTQTIKTIAQELLDIDQKHARIAPELMKHIKKNIKEINNGKNLNTVYQYNEYMDSALFDQKK